MFSPATKRSSRRGRDASRHPSGSPPTPQSSPLIHGRPATGTPVPWAPRLSVLARVPPEGQSESPKKDDSTKPVHISEFPQLVRDGLSRFFRNCIPGDSAISGGMDKESSLCWVICGNKVFIWSYLPSQPSSKKCVALDLPEMIFREDISSSWTACFVNWDNSRKRDLIPRGLPSVGLLMCNRRTMACVYCPDIYGEGRLVASSIVSGERDVVSSSVEGKTASSRKRQSPQHLPPQQGRSATNLARFDTLVSVISTPMDIPRKACLALAASSNGDLWQLCCDVAKIEIFQVNNDLGQLVPPRKICTRSLAWRLATNSDEESEREFFLLTDYDVQCFSVKFDPVVLISKCWSQEIPGNGRGLDIKEDLIGDKTVCPLDMEVDDTGKFLTVLVATLSLDETSSFSYTKYSLLIIKYATNNILSHKSEARPFYKRISVQVILPTSEVEDKNFLFSMRLRIGGKPLDSAVILSDDGTATVSHNYMNSTRLYQFNLPYDAGKVIDASVLPPVDESEGGTWVVLTEKAGIWAIPEEAIRARAVDPSKINLNLKNIENKEVVMREDRKAALGSGVASRKSDSDAWDASERQRVIDTEISCSSTFDEESEVLLGQLFQNYLTTGQATSFQKLEKAGSFMRNGELNVFTRFSKSIVDTLAKHWTTTRGAEIMSLAIFSSQLYEKQQKHEHFLQFLALSKCHEELCSKQRQALLTILEHGEKLFAMVQLREMQNRLGQNRSNGTLSSDSILDSQSSGALWSLIQLVGETARRKNALLLDRDNAEVFYTKVSNLEDMFRCLGQHLEYIIERGQSLEIQVQRLCDISNVIVSVLRSAIQYKSEHHIWYPAPEGLIPWYCQSVVRNGFWKVASFMLEFLDDASGLNDSVRSDLYTSLERLTEVFLETYVGAISAKLDSGEDIKSIREEYWSRRESLLDSLYNQVRYFVEGTNQMLKNAKEELPEEMLRKLSSTLLTIARRHEGYTTMWKISCDLNDFELTKKLMRESMGPRGGFSYFVFKQLYEKKKFSKLLRLGEEFQAELYSFLKDHRDLLWLHELFLHQFSSASESLHSLALTQANALDSENTGYPTPNPIVKIKTFSDRERFLRLAKISAIAGKDEGSMETVKRIEADLKILKLQEVITEVFGANEPMLDNGLRLLLPEDLIRLCLRGATSELALLAFDVFAWTSSSFRRTHTNLLEECWRNAADQDDWEQIHQSSTVEGWSDDEILHHLTTTVLFQASNRCYSEDADTFDGGFHEVLPLTFADGHLLSVESILTHHRHFPDAGKLMKAAVVLGSQSDPPNSEDNLHTAMQ